MEENIISFKATANGLILIMREEDDFDSIYEHVARKLESSGRFFKGASLTVKYRGKKLNPDEEQKSLNSYPRKQMLKFRVLKKTYQPLNPRRQSPIKAGKNLN